MNVIKPIPALILLSNSGSDLIRRTNSTRISSQYFFRRNRHWNPRAQFLPWLKTWASLEKANVERFNFEKR